MRGSVATLVHRRVTSGFGAIFFMIRRAPIVSLRNRTRMAVNREPATGANVFWLIHDY
jgi:hypothetical protein